MLPEWKLVSGETLKIRKKKATFAIIFISIFIIIGIVTFSYLRLKSSRESAAVSCIEEDIKKGSVSAGFGGFGCYSHSPSGNAL